MDIFLISFVLIQITGVVSSVYAILNTRTPQGAIAWVVSLNTLPAIAVPAYWIFGRNKFSGYVEARREQSRDIRDDIERFHQDLHPYAVDKDEAHPAYEAAKYLALSPLLSGNKVQLLIDGQATFDSIYEGIDQAESYVLFQFYILRDDDIGNRFRKLLAQKAEEGVKVYVLYDGLGSVDLKQTWLKKFKDAGIRIVPFRTRQWAHNSFQLNFRNHRKIVVVDGKVTWLGGLNIGDDYVGKDDRLTPWRDTHLRVDGPATLVAQSIFWSDWYYADKRILNHLSWKPVHASASSSGGSMEADSGVQVMVLGSGPADNLETASLFYTNAINSARKRIWIATPYFIPDEGTLVSLHLALLKGIDVRIITPGLNDNWFVRHAAQVYLSDLSQLGARLYSFQKGFMHQKVMLIDDSISTVGTVNFDNRSFRLNFEVTCLIDDPGFADEMEAMLREDMANSVEIRNYDLARESLWERLKSRGCALLSPVL